MEENRIPDADLPRRLDGRLPLNGLRVVACELLVALPFGTQVLADLGADVIDIEHANFRSDPDTRWRLRTGRHKRRIAVNLRDPRGQMLARELATRADVFAQNYRPGVTDKYGLSYKELSAINPRLIYASMSGFGQREVLASPIAGNAAYGSIAEAISGVSHTMGESGRAGIALGDIISSLFAMIGIMAALRDRDRTGVGQYVDISMADCLLSISERQILTEELARVAGELATKATEATLLKNAGWGAIDIQAMDGRITVVILDGDAGENSHWGRFCRIVGHPEWTHDSRLLDPATRRTTIEQVVRPAVDKWAQAYPKIEAAAEFRQAGLAAAAVLTPAETFSEAHFEARRMFQEVEDEDGKHLRVAGNPIKMSKVEENPPTATPRISTPGEQTREILANELGLGSDEIEDLIARGIVVDTRTQGAVGSMENVAS